MQGAARSRRSFRFRGRSIFALVLAPDAPLVDWLDELDAWIGSSPDFFFKKPFVLDLAKLTLPEAEFHGLIEQLRYRNVRVIGVEGVDPAWLGPGLAPLPPAGETFRATERMDDDAADDDEAPAPQAASLLLDKPVRSGQAVIFPDGDVTILGSIASGAEVIAGGSIHVYGALRGRAMAGSAGNTRAQIFCSNLHAELLAIGGLYRLADDMAPDLRGRRVHAWLDHDVMVMKNLD